MNQDGTLLKGKTALVFGAGGAVGRAVCGAFLAEGARVYMSGRRRAVIEEAFGGIGASSDFVIDEVDATNEQAVSTYVTRVRQTAGRIDVVFNAIGSHHARPVTVMPSTDVPLDSFMEYMSTMVRSQFLTAREAARSMIEAHSGVVILLGATPAKGIAPFLAGPSTGHAAVEGLARSLATEWGPHGVRVVAVRSGGMQETPNIRHVLGQFAALQGVSLDDMLRLTNERALLRRTPTLADTAGVVAFLASDRAKSITGAIVNASCGEVLD